MPYYLDYSAARLSGNTIKAAGYSGAIRYIDSPPNLGTKHTNLAEYQSHKAAGLDVLLVMQTTTTASDGGYLAGQEHARRALAGAQYLGYIGPIFFTNDRTTVPDAGAWRGYLDGAASVLSVSRVGAYGFRNAVDLALGHASYFWQSGRRSDVAGHVHVWQDNNVQVQVGGITCDRNLILKPITEEDMNSEQDAALAAVWKTVVSGQDYEQSNLSRQLGYVVGRVNAAVSLAQDVKAQVDALQLGGVDLAELARVILPLMPSAAEIVDEIDRRNRDGNPNTGQVS